MFEQGRPVRDLTLRIGERAGRSDENGAWIVSGGSGGQSVTADLYGPYVDLNNYDAAGNLVFSGWGVFGAVISGLILGLLIGKVTEYYTSEQMGPAREIANQSSTGPATTSTVRNAGATHMPNPGSCGWPG